MPDEVKEPLTEEEQVRQWECRVEMARRYQNKHGDTDGRWTKNVKALAGDFNSKEDIGPEAIDVNMIRSSVKTSLPPLWINEPFITIRPTTPEFKGADNVQRAEYTELEVNYWMRELEVRKQVKKVILDGETTNHGYLYIGYTKKKSDVKSEGVHTENNPLVRHKQPFVRRISPKKVLVPPGYEDLESCPWVDLIFLKPLEDVRRKYGEEATGGLAPTERVGEPAKDDTAEFSEYLKSPDAKLVEVHNVWDKRSRKVYIFAKQHSKFLEEPKAWPYEVEGFPLAHYSPENVPDEYYATPPVSYYLPQNIELNITRTAMKKRRSRTKAVIFVAADIEEEVKAKYRDAEDGEMVPIDTGGEDLRGKMHTDPGIPFDTGDLAYDATIKDDIRTATGLGAEQRGSGDPNVDSATASANIEKHAQVRGSDRGDLIRDVYLTTARKLWMILQQFPNVKRTRLIAGERAGIFRNVTYTLAELKGEFAFDMDVSAMLADNPATRQTQSMVNYNMMRADPLVNPENLLLDVYKAQNKPNPERYLLFLRQPDQEHQLMIQGLPVEPHERDNHEAHMGEHDTHGDMLAAALQQVDPASPPGEKVRTALLLVLAHSNAHAKMMQEIAGEGGKPAGQPVAENMLRNQVKVAKGGETAAEVTGQPLTPEGMVQ